MLQLERYAWNNEADATTSGEDEWGVGPLYPSRDSYANANMMSEVDDHVPGSPSLLQEQIQAPVWSCPGLFFLVVDYQLNPSLCLFVPVCS